jgi:soluble lytic murein transglycosylase-like protein
VTIRSVTTTRRAAPRIRIGRLLALYLGLAAATATVAIPGFASRAQTRSREPSRLPHAAAATAPPQSRCPLPRQLRPAFERAAAHSAVPLALLTAVAETESRFDPHAASAAGAVGAMQVLPRTARSFGLNAHDPSENVLAAAKYLHQLLGTLGSADLAIAAYNAGPTAVANAGAAPTAETAAYVGNVERRWRRLQGCI